MKRTLDIDVALTSFEDKPLTIDVDGKSRPMVLQDVLLIYCRHADHMGLDEFKLNTVYSLGQVIGGHKKGAGAISLTGEQYDVLKGICDSGKIKNPDNSERYLIPIEGRVQAKHLVDAAKQGEV